MLETDVSGPLCGWLLSTPSPDGACNALAPDAAPGKSSQQDRYFCYISRPGALASKKR
jgi:hypothetical protein